MVLNSKHRGYLFGENGIVFSLPYTSAKGDNQRCRQNKHCTCCQLFVRRPGHLVCQLIVAGLAILNEFLDNFHFFCLLLCTGRRTRTHDPRFWRPMLYQLSYSRVTVECSALRVERLCVWCLELKPLNSEHSTFDVISLRRPQ